jgi:hypothetical protein
MNPINERLGMELQEVNPAELTAVTGGYDENNWCGTPWRHGPLPTGPGVVVDPVRNVSLVQVISLVRAL